MGIFRRKDKPEQPSAGTGAAAGVVAGVGAGAASWLAYPTLTHGDATMVKMAGPQHYRRELAAAIQRHGPLVLAELSIEPTGQYAGAVRVLVDGVRVATLPAGMEAEYRAIVQQLAAQRQPATIHAELELDEWANVWGLCAAKPRRDSEPLLPTQYRVDVTLLDGVAAELDAGLNSRAKEKKVRRNWTLSLRAGGLWSVLEDGRQVGTLPVAMYRRLHDLVAAGFPTDVEATVHRRPDRPLKVHVSIPPDR